MYFNVCKLFTCSLENWPGCLSGLSGTWTQSGPGCRAPISHHWHGHVMVCQISLLLPFQEVEHSAADISEHVCVCVPVCGWVCVCLLLRYFNNKRPIFPPLLNTEAFAWCALEAFTCRVGYKCGQTLGLLPRLCTLAHTSPTHLNPHARHRSHPRSSLSYLSPIERNRLLKSDRGKLQSCEPGGRKINSFLTDFEK